MCVFRCGPPLRCPRPVCVYVQKSALYRSAFSQGSDLDNIAGMASSRPAPAGTTVPSGLGSTHDTCRGDTTPNVNILGQAERLQGAGTNYGPNSTLSHTSGSGSGLFEDLYAQSGIRSFDRRTGGHRFPGSQSMSAAATGDRGLQLDAAFNSAGGSTPVRPAAVECGHG